ncbi:hypothetical protein Tco_1312448 [Tanacetum coccineum]
MKAHPKHIDWGKLTVTQEIMDWYVMPKYGKTNEMEDYSWIDIIVDDIYDTFYRDEEEEAKVAKASEDIKLSIMKDKFLAMVEFEKAIVKDYTKLVVTDGMVDYVLEKYGNTWKCEDKISSIILEDLWLKYGKNDKGKGAEHHHLKGKEKAKQVDDHDDDVLDSLDLANRIKNLEEDFGREVKKAKEAKKAREVESKENEAKKAKEAELKAKKAKEPKEAKKAMLAELKGKKAKEAMLTEVVQISIDEDDDKDPTAPTSRRTTAPIASTSTRSKAPTAYTSTRSRAPITSTSNAQVTSTTPKGYMKIAMTGCVLALFAPNAPPPFPPTRKRKST